MGILAFLFLKLFFFWAILTVFEVAVIRRMKVSTFKYIKLLKIFELITPFIALIISQGPRQVVGMTFLVFFFLSLTYFGILLYDVFKGMDRQPSEHMGVYQV